MRKWGSRATNGRFLRSISRVKVLGFEVEQKIVNKNINLTLYFLTYAQIQFDTV